MKKKLKDFFLSKETLSILDDQIMNSVKGGYFTQEITSYSNCNAPTMFACFPPLPTSNMTCGCPAASDLRYKKDISNIANPLHKLLNLTGVTYDWKLDEYPNHGFEDKQQIGFIAQDVEKILPEVVSTDADGFKSIHYGLITPIIVESVKFLVDRLKMQQEEIALLKSKVNSFDNILERISKMEEAMAF